jgi:hypothetical protein
MAISSYRSHADQSTPKERPERLAKKLTMAEYTVVFRGTCFGMDSESFSFRKQKPCQINGASLVSDESSKRRKWSSMY